MKKRKKKTAEDRENPFWTEKDFARAKPAAEFFSAGELKQLKKKRGQRGPQKAPVKERISIRLDSDIVQRYRAAGRGWQGKMNENLRRTAPRA